MMAKNFELFLTIEKLFQSLGVSTSKTNRKWSVLLKRSFFLSSFGANAVFTVIFLVYEAKTMQEFSDSMFVATTGICNIILNFHFVGNKQVIKTLTDKFNAFFRESKLFLKKA